MFCLLIMNLTRPKLIYTVYLPLCVSVRLTVFMSVLPTRGAHQVSPECVELKPPAGRRRIAVVKYSSSIPGGTLFTPCRPTPAALSIARGAGKA